MAGHFDKLQNAFDFKGRTIVMTGGTGVLGSEIACALADCGAQLAIIHLNPNRGADLLKRLGGRSENVALFHADVLQIASLQQAAVAILNRFGKIDSLINAAGGNRPRATTSADLKFFDLPFDALREVFDVNLLGTMLCCQVFGRTMAESGSGVILNVSSMNAFRPLTRIAPYSAAKAGVNNFTQWLAVHMAQEYSPNIRINAIAPGFFLTEQNRFLLLERETGASTARGNAILAHTPMARFGKPEELVGAALWLLSPASAFVTGAIVPIDGGFSAFSGV
jgi:NAD(P)-dependent dehydrogenase (short-subunit alcohol dehydrogenase family)